MASTPSETWSVDGDATQILELTLRAEALLAEGDAVAASNTASRAAAMRDAPDRTWLVLARSYEALSDWPGAFGAYGQALERTAEPGAVAGPMARLGLRLGYYPRAVALFQTHLEHEPPTPDAIAGLAWALAKTRDYAGAQAALQTALQADPGQAVLWLTLGKVLCLQGRHHDAPVFLQEALRLDPDSADARDGMADALLFGGGDPDEGLAWGEDAVARATGPNVKPIVADQARRLLGAGRLAEGWTLLARGSDPQDPAAVTFPCLAARRWRDGDVLDGRLLLMAEDGLVAEILLAQAIPDMIAEGLRVILAISPSWIPLARRSFPDARIAPRAVRLRRGDLQSTAELEMPHAHEGEAIAAWAPLSALMESRRARPEHFARAAPYIRPDPERVAHWQRRMGGAPGRLKVGLAWRGLPADGVRDWEAPPLPELASALSASGLTFIALQQQMPIGETRWLRDVFDLDVNDLPEDFRDEDLEDFAALIGALDLVVGPPCLATVLAGAIGAPTIILSTPAHWAQLGTEGFPWFPHAHVITAEAPGVWGGAMAALYEALESFSGR